MEHHGRRGFACAFVSRIIARNGAIPVPVETYRWVRAVVRLEHEPALRPDQPHPRPGCSRHSEVVKRMIGTWRTYIS